ncbi:hypothetical protein XAP6164_3020053 [Xanthomonas phaseoli pv. phaseoli]|nr:hypothetical protein XAP6164_3020053 [Xanthomonas phaseoli pv. phaseoli]
MLPPAVRSLDPAMGCQRPCRRYHAGLRRGRGAGQWPAVAELAGWLGIQGDPCQERCGAQVSAQEREGAVPLIEAKSSDQDACADRQTGAAGFDAACALVHLGCCALSMRIG